MKCRAENCTSPSAFVRVVVIASKAALVRRKSTDGNHTASGKANGENWFLSLAMHRQAQFDEEDPRCWRKNFQFCAPDTHLRAGYTGRMVTPPKGPRKWSCASTQEERRCVLPLSHWPLPIQKHELSKSCAHLVFCMRPRICTSLPDVPTGLIAKSGEGAFLACELGCQETTGVVCRQHFVTNHYYRYTRVVQNV